MPRGQAVAIRADRVEPRRPLAGGGNRRDGPDAGGPSGPTTKRLSPARPAITGRHIPAMPPPRRFPRAGANKSGRQPVHSRPGLPVRSKCSLPRSRSLLPSEISLARQTMAATCYPFFGGTYQGMAVSAQVAVSLLGKSISGKPCRGSSPVFSSLWRGGQDRPSGRCRRPQGSVIVRPRTIGGRRNSGK